MSSAAQAMLATARAVLEREASAVAGAADQIATSFTDAASLILAADGLVFVSGIGTSHAVALRLAHLLSCCGTRAVFLHPADAGHGGAGAIAAGDVVIVISKGGESAEVNSFADVARGRGAQLIVLTERPASTLARMAHIVLHVAPAADVDPFGMIATGSSLVFSAVGDALCVVLLEARGYSRDQFAQTHPGGAVGRDIAAHIGSGAANPQTSEPQESIDGRPLSQKPRTARR